MTPRHCHSHCSAAQERRANGQPKRTLHTHMGRVPRRQPQSTDMPPIAHWVRCVWGLPWPGLPCWLGGETQKCDRRRRRSVLDVPKKPTVSLRPRTDDDLDLLFDIASDLDTWEERGPQAPRPLTRARFDARLAGTADDHGPEASVSLVIDVDGTAVGSATLFDFDLLARHAEAGINLERNARGRGIGTAAVIQLVEFGFGRHNLRRIHLQAISSNVAAIRAYEKAGFVIEGRQRQHAWVRGNYEDIVRMGILRSEQTSFD